MTTAKWLTQERKTQLLTLLNRSGNGFRCMYGGTACPMSFREELTFLLSMAEAFELPVEAFQLPIRETYVETSLYDGDAAWGGKGTKTVRVNMPRDIKRRPPELPGTLQVLQGLARGMPLLPGLCNNPSHQFGKVAEDLKAGWLADDAGKRVDENRAERERLHTEDLPKVGRWTYRTSARRRQSGGAGLLFKQGRFDPVARDIYERQNDGFRIVGQTVNLIGQRVAIVRVLGFPIKLYVDVSHVPGRVDAPETAGRIRKECEKAVRSFHQGIKAAR